jgi:hypothetical protein
MPEAERFWSKVDKHGRCWIWTASKDEKGYGYFGLTSVNGKSRVVRAHRWAWEQENGPVPEGLMLDHVVCDNPSCVNPAHLALTTSAGNTLRSTKALAAVNARKTHCSTCGQEYDTIYIVRGRPKRYCSPCSRERTRKWKLDHA